MNRGRGTAREGPTRQQIIQSILELQRQNEEIKLKAEADQIQLEKEREEARKKAEEDLQLLREEALGERERLRKEVEETHRMLEDALQQQEQLQKANKEMQNRLDATRIGYRYSSFQAEDLVLRKAQLIQIDSKLAPKWTRPYRIKEVLGEGAYKLETLDGKEILRTWNATNLRFYFS